MYVCIREAVSEEDYTHCYKSAVRNTGSSIAGIWGLAHGHEDA